MCGAANSLYIPTYIVTFGYVMNGPSVMNYLNDPVLFGNLIVAQLVKKFTPSHAT